MTKQDQLYDVIVIGGGTTGLYAAYYSELRNMKTKLIEASNDFGGKVALFFPEKKVYDVGALPGATGKQIVTQLSEQASMFELTIESNQWIDKIDVQADHTYVLTTANGIKHYTKTIILATGNGKFSIVGPELFDAVHDENVHTTIENWQQYQGKRIVIFSNNQTGVEWATMLDKIVESVYIINEKSTYQKAKQQDLQRLAQSNVQERINTTIIKVNRTGNQVTEVAISNRDGEQERIVVDDVLMHQGLQMQTTPFDVWGLDTEQGRVLTNTRMTTNKQGIFVAGDAAIYPGKTMLIASGFSEAITAVNSAKRYLDPKASAQVYTTVLFRDKM